MNMSDNHAGVSGSNLFGGLLDRCTVHNELSKESQMNESGITIFKNLHNINKSQLDTISSHLVVCMYPIRNKISSISYSMIVTVAI